MTHTTHARHEQYTTRTRDSEHIQKKFPKKYPKKGKGKVLRIPNQKGWERKSILIKRLRTNFLLFVGNTSQTATHPKLASKKPCLQCIPNGNTSLHGFTSIT